jgi:hypothetical protein
LWVFLVVFYWKEDLHAALALALSLLGVSNYQF